MTISIPKTNSKMNVRHQKQAGFTIIEVTIFMGLLTVFMFLLTTIFVTILETQADSIATTTIELESQYLSSRLRYDMNQAESISLPADLGDIGSSLSLVINGQTVTFYIENDVLFRQVESVPVRLTSTDIRVLSWQVERLGNDDGKHMLDMALQLESAVGGPTGQESRTLYISLGER